MSTRAYIGIKNQDETITAIYNHCDGGLANLGHLLKKYFDTEEKVRELIGFGYISSIQDNQTYDELREILHSFDYTEWKSLNKVPDCKVHCMPTGHEAEIFSDIQDITCCMICYVYLFIPKEKKWYYMKGTSGKVKKL